MNKRNRRSSPRRGTRYLYLLLGAVAVVAVIGYLLLSSSYGTRTASTLQTSKPVILYVNQGNGVVNASNLQGLLEVSKSHGFNTVFFQIYRSGSLLFTDDSLRNFVDDAHGQGLKFFFALYFTNATQRLPTSVYADGEDGINLDMSTLPTSAQTSLFDNLSASYSGTTAITTTDPGLTLRPNLLVLETYGTADEQLIRQGIVASVGVFATSSKQDYDRQFQYALSNSDGVMVFDYAGLVKAGY
ncbi:MAG: hypothetical protein OK455_02305 [Thaumarchaeota archaeon]|nr:hypothetical protein [Nitrososphaerota archaeon]